MISDEQINLAKSQISDTLFDVHFEHNDCIRIAYQWLDAQRKTKGITSATNPLKHHIEKWAGRYVSVSDVSVAAFLHPEIKGKYPHFNISTRLTEPSLERLNEIPESMTQDYRERYDPSIYKVSE